MHETYKKWLDDGKPKLTCQCGCEKEIIIKRHHKSYGIPEYLSGHQNIGENNPNFGKHFSEEHKQKIRIAVSGDRSPHFGKHQTEEHKQKIRTNMPNMSGKNSVRFGVKPSSKVGRGKRSYYNSPLQGKVCFRSSWELLYAQYLDDHKILWKYEEFTFDLSNTTYTPDFYLLKENKFIEIKGYMSEISQLKINKFLENIRKIFKYYIKKI